MKECPVCETKFPIVGKSRSLDQLRRYYAMIRAAYMHWKPENEVQFSSEEDCRKTLQMMAGYREVGSRTKLTGVRPENAVMLAQAAIAGAGAFARPVVHNGWLIVWRPLSISFSKMSHHEFCKLNDDVAAVIEAETGMKIEDMMQVAA